MVEIRVSMPFIKRRDEFSPYQIGLANAEAAVVMVVHVGFLNSLHGEPGHFVEAQLDGGIEPHVGRYLLGDAGAETVA